MNWIDKLEKKYGRFGIPNLTLYVIIGYVIGTLLQMFFPVILSWCTLDIPKILHGQIWRLVTWVLFPPAYSNILFFALAMVLFYYPIGTSLERIWGSFRYTLYLFTGLVITILGAFVVYFLIGASAVHFPWQIFTTYYLTLSLILVFSLSMPDAQVLLWFVIPIKMRWMAYFYLGLMVYEIFQDAYRGYWFMAIPIICSLINFGLFYFSGIGKPRFHFQGTSRAKKTSPFEKMRMGTHRSSTPPTGMGSQNVRHRCAVCGRTELDDPNLEFRFCSRCKGNFEYCQDHLFTHEHKV